MPDEPRDAANEGSRIDADRWSRIEALFFELRGLPAAQRDARLSAACGEDEALRLAVADLLAGDDRSRGFLETPALGPGASVQVRAAGASGRREREDDASEPDSLVGRRVGAYRLLRRIGAGGMGAVYLAERADDAFHKQVAVKIIRRGMATDDVLLRFRRERQVLAQLDHPNIARLIDGGATDDGLSYLVMEHVEGDPIHVHCDRRGLSLAQRLELFRRICAPVQYAHQHLVVHRDLKPANILITPDGEPKLLDFGIAKVLDDSDAAAAAVTAPAMRLLTPRYASPEQLRQGAITTATDIYSLGVLLYELLTGRHPFDVDTGSLAELERAVLTREPTRPSRAVVDARSSSEAPDSGAAVHATQRGPGSEATPGAAVRSAEENRRLRSRLSGDLDNIVLQALHKDPLRRYASVEQFSEDIRRHLAGLPVAARADTLRYRASKFARRHAAGVAAAVVLFVGLLTATLVSTTSYLRAERALHQAQAAEAEARSQGAIAKQINDFLVDMLGAANPTRAKGRDLGLLRDVIDAAAAGLTKQFHDQPKVETALRITVGDTYRRLGLYDEALPQFRAALERRTAALGADHPDTLEAADNLGMLLYDMSDFDAAEKLVRQALDGRRHKLGARHAATLLSIHNLGEMLADRGRHAEAEALFTESLDGRRALHGTEHRDVLMTLNRLAGEKFRLGKVKEAQPLMTEALALQRKLLGEDHPDTLVTMNDLAEVLRKLGRLDEAARLFEQAVAGMQRLRGPSHMDTLITRHNLARLLAESGQVDAAETRLRAAIADADAGLPRGHWVPDVMRITLGRVLLGAKGPAAAEPVLLQALDGLRKSVGDDHPYAVQLRDLLAKMYEAWGKPHEAAKHRSARMPTTASAPGNRS